ncbi:NAD(P)H-dependent oxidoreductase [Shewanella sp. AS16]|uniref:NADPH-dependent FMN reductase n=1 Tax=Shewanella sp. AS16 TaxID=2907625 RepID=UPI001F3C3BE2|nr:NAD(P)H-dependent oxidoreductase [Shewanella sp. AS16]MCE9685369.1 NAD(P)H-dependent oxidoreductase [Shewanella sp. AS16]
MNLLVVSSSQRLPSESAKVAEYIVKTSQGYDEIFHLELCRYQLPFWNGEPLAKGEDWDEIELRLSKADALVLVTPEWGGVASPLLKNFLLMCDRQTTAHKPALLVSVSSGINGAYPIAELRMNSFKNNKLVAIPDHLIIRDVNNMLGELCSGEHDINLRSRVAYSLHMLKQYSQALSQIRMAHAAQAYPMEQEYAYGM